MPKIFSGMRAWAGPSYYTQGDNMIRFSFSSIVDGAGETYSRLYLLHLDNKPEWFIDDAEATVYMLGGAELTPSQIWKGHIYA